MSFFSKRYQENTKLLYYCKLVADVCIAIALGFSLTLFTCERSSISGSSMEPCINNGDTVLINKLAYSYFPPSRFSVVAFRLRDSRDSRLYIKRVVGLPGERLQIKEGKVYINGNQLEDFVDTDIIAAGIASSEITLGEDEYFVLGDNRNNSEDSRFTSIGVVNADEIVGKVWFILEPSLHLGIVK